MDINDFDYYVKSTSYGYRRHRQRINSFYIYLIVGTYMGIKSNPEYMDKDFLIYNKVIVQFYNDDRKDLAKYNSYIQNNEGYIKRYLMPLDLAFKMLDIAIGNTQSNIIQIGPCCKCGLVDEWNSIGKDGKSYCYIHCYNG